MRIMQQIYSGEHLDIPGNKMEKKLVYLLSSGDYSNIVMEELSAVEEWINGDTSDLKQDEDVSDHEYVIKLAWMTQTEIDNLPEAE